MSQAKSIITLIRIEEVVTRLKNQAIEEGTRHSSRKVGILMEEFAKGKD